MIKAFIIDDCYYYSSDYKRVRQDEDWLRYAFEEHLQDNECSLSFPYKQNDWLIVEGNTKKEIEEGKYTVLESYGGNEAQDYKKTIDFINLIGGSFSVLRIVGDY